MACSLGCWPPGACVPALAFQARPKDFCRKNSLPEELICKQLLDSGDRLWACPSTCTTVDATTEHTRPFAWPSNIFRINENEKHIVRVLQALCDFLLHWKSHCALCEKYILLRFQSPIDTFKKPNCPGSFSYIYISLCSLFSSPTILISSVHTNSKSDFNDKHQCNMF